MNESVIVGGRPYGGVAILYRHLQKGVETIWLESRRVCAIKFVLEFGLLYIFNMYMSCDQYSYINTYIKVLREISNYCMINNVEFFLLGGDLNTDFILIQSH